MVSQGFSPERAPLSAAGVADAVRPFGESRMLPRAAYVDPAVFAWEQQHFFGGGWLCVGWPDQLPGPGDQRAADWGLAGLPVTEWHGLVFVDGSGTAAPLAEPGTGALGMLEDIVAPYEPERLVVAGRHEYETAANWKILTENYHECYHCPAIHPELCKVSPPKSGVNFDAPGTWIGGTMQLRDGMDTMSLDGTSDGVPLRGLDAHGLRSVAYINVFPNILLSLHPDYVMVHRLTPLAVDRTRIECTWAFAPEALERPGFDPRYAVDFWDITNRQDWAACESVQRGLSSPHARPGPLAPEEDAVYQFVSMVGRGYQGHPVWNPGTVSHAG